MTGDRWQRVELTLAGAVRRASGGVLCAVCRDELAVAGTAITLASGENRSLLCATSARIAALEELQFTLGEGPSLDAYTDGRAVLAPDLRGESAQPRWDEFADSAVDAGIGAMFAFPLRVGEERLGVLTLYQAEPGRLASAVATEAMVLCALVTDTILTMQAAARPAHLADALADAGASRAEVHQASGMVSVQLGVGVVEALIRLRSHAYASGRPLSAVAADVVGRRLRLDR